MSVGFSWKELDLFVIPNRILLRCRLAAMPIAHIAEARKHLARGVFWLLFSENPYNTLTRHIHFIFSFFWTMLPITLFQSNHVLVKGSHYQTTWYDESGKPAGLLDAIELNFIIQVNGRICEFTESFTLEKSEASGEMSITQWDNWYLIVRILKNLWYSLSDEPDTIYTENWPIKAWVRSILASVQESPQVELER